MPAKNITSKCLRLLLIGALIVAGTAGIADVAHADPHAIFYTAIGQQQLFFNFLAALDQADYVETGIAREQRRQAREDVSAWLPFTRETDSSGQFTAATEIERSSQRSGKAEPALLNRQITLEGHDLYTDQLVRQFGAESARRNAAAELLIALCENSFGFDNCDFDTYQKTDEEKRQIYDKRARAYIADPLKWSQMPYWYGVWSALNSGNTAANIYWPNPLTTKDHFTDEEFRQQKALHPDVFGGEPMAYSAEIDVWRQQATGDLGLTSSDKFFREATLNGLLYDVRQLYGVKPSSPVNFPYREFGFDSNGKEYLLGLSYDKTTCGNSVPCLNPNAPTWSIAKQPGMTVIKYLKSITEMVQSGESRARSIASSAGERVAYQLAMAEDKGVIANTGLVAQPPKTTTSNYKLSQYGELELRLNTPVAARLASLYGIPNVLGQLATSQQASALVELNQPGSVPLVNRGNHTASSSTSPSPSPNNTNPPLSLVGSQTGRAGVVAGTLATIFDSAKYPLFDEAKTPVSPSANIISPLLEFGASHALRMLTGGQWRPSDRGIGCGFTCD